MKALEKIDFHPYEVGSWTLSQTMFKQLAGDLVNKNVYTVMSFHPFMSPKAKEFHDKMMAKYGHNDFPVGAAQSYDGMKMLLKALDKVGPGPKKIRDYLEQMNDFEGVTSIPSGAGHHHPAAQVRGDWHHHGHRWRSPSS